MSAWRLGDLTCQPRVSECLVKAGMQPEGATQKGAHFAQAAKQLLSSGINLTSPAHGRFVPGRIEVLGKHTDYAGGRSLTAAVDRGFSAIGVARQDGKLRVTDASSGETVVFPISRDLVPAAGHWSNYPMTVARRMARNFYGPFRGAEISFFSDLPQASGMSSSSALLIAVFQLLSDVHDLTGQEVYQQNIQTTLDLAGYMATIENGQSFGALVGDRGVGTFGGSEDHTAILNSRPGHFVQYAYCPVRVERSVAVDPAYRFAIASSGVLAEKTGAVMEKYNRASKLATAVVEIWRQATGRDDPHLAAAMDSAADACNRLHKALQSSQHAHYQPQELANRLQHFVQESQMLIPAVPSVLDRSTSGPFGRLVARSQTLAADLLGNQVPETILLAESAQELGAVAASAFGAGFGGSVWALVEREQSPAFLEAWQARYREAFPETAQRATFFPSTAGPAAFAL